MKPAMNIHHVSWHCWNVSRSEVSN